VKPRVKNTPQKRAPEGSGCQKGDDEMREEKRLDRREKRKGVKPYGFCTIFEII
jgi:hypothetical protein